MNIKQVTITSLYLWVTTSRVIVDMAFFVYFVGVILASASATSPIVDDTASVPRKCPENEVLKSRVSCPPDTCDTQYLSFLCIADQVPSVVCTCKDNYLRTNSTGVCVPVDRCLPAECANDPNAKSGCGNRCKKTCADYNDTTKVCKNNVCKLFGCDCMDEFVYDDNVQKCVKPSQCTKQCKKPHQRYSTCLLGECVPKTCEDLGQPIACPRIAGPCAGGCICEEGYVTDSKGNCIDKTTCPSCGGDPNAQGGCGNPCGKTCASRGVNQTELKCPEYCEINGCDCKPGYLLDTDAKKCVPEKSCPTPPPQCGRNELYYCGTTCLEASCSDPAVQRCANKKCKLGCFCKNGFVRKSNNTCVNVDECPEQQCKKENERYSICPLGECVPTTCEDLGKPVACASIAAPCAGGCTCREGFVKNSKGDCIDKTKCPSCGGDPNAISGCGNSCGKTCASRAPNVAQTFCQEICNTNGCDCKKGFLLDTDSNKCVPEKSCPNSSQCKGPHEVYNSCPAGQCGPKTCDNLIRPAPCPRVIPPCPGGCLCEEGYLRDSNEICIEKNKCPQQSCNSNETYALCNTYCPSQYCPTDDQPQAACDIPKNCPPGCICKSNYKYNLSGQCILASDCPSLSSQCKGPHEVYISCPVAQCDPKTCDNLIRPAPCPKAPRPCPGGCVCEEGYLRDSNEICIKKNKCPQQACNSNQTYVSCNINCPDKYCPKDDQPQPVCDPPRNCPPGCSCKINYRLDKSGQCILASECPAINCTRQNEEYNSCPSACLAENCEDADTPPAVCNTLLLNCQPKCICKKGNFRNKDGLCVPAKECPSVCKDPNAEWNDCRDPCPGTCQNTKPGCLSKTCTAGCQCKDGYVLSKTGGECVKTETCADYACCGGNQTFVSCTFKCPQVMCPDSDQTILCKPPRDCPGGCGCKPNYRYNADGDCILGSECPPVECTRSNEEWAPCRSEYDWERCDDRFNSPPIIGDDDDSCNPRCTCIEGYFKNNAYECVPEKECPPIS